MVTTKGGDNYAKALAKIADKLSNVPVLRVGFLEGATYPDGTSVALVAAVQDFGSPTNNIPPRPFFRNMVRKQKTGWPVLIKKTLLSTTYDVNRTLAIVGEVIKGQLQQSIHETNSPPLAPATIARKGSDKPLIDTGHMLNSVDYEVVKKE